MSDQRFISLVLVDNIERELTCAAWRRSSVACEHLTQSFLYDPPSMNSLDDVAQAIWYEAWRHTTSVTTHILYAQYDGWVLDGSLWRDSWFDYDYIGAPWPWHSTLRVGNGGFSLRSRKLLEFLSTHRAEFPLRPGHPEDDLLCRHYRPALEVHGFRWAPEHEARVFAFEREALRPAFGFHGLWHVPEILGRGFELDTWLAAATPYARSKPEWRELEAAMAVQS